MRILVTGAAGYIGSVLCTKLRAAGHEVCGVDIGWFGIPDESWCRRGDIREIQNIRLEVDAVIHLAAVSNDPMCELNGRLAWEVNVLGTSQLLNASALSGVKRFIYASSGSVYGVCDWPRVTELAPLNPISDYNKTKLVAERIVWNDANDMQVHIVRPATVCGYSPRMRLDTVVNRYTIQAMKDGVIEVWGGEQVRPHIHIDDMTDLYLWLLNHDDCEIWNAGFENLTLTELAEHVSDLTGARIVHKPSNDPRSYRLDSSRLLKAGFQPKKGVFEAVRELIEKIEIGELKDEPKHYNLQVLRGLQKAA